MKKYIKPEIEIEVFDVPDTVNAVGTSSLLPENPELQLNSDEVFYGIEAGDEGYLVNNY